MTVDFETVRVFVALNIEVAALRRVVETALRLRALPGAPPGVRWVTPAKLHVTLKFLGPVDAALVPALRDALGAVAADAPSPRLAFTGIGAFPSTEEARVVFATVDDLGDETRALAAAVEAAVIELGLPRDTRPYVPHLTLARLTSPANVAPWVEPLPKWRAVGLAPELVLYRSDLTRARADYDALGRFRLAPRKTVRA